MIIIPLLNPLKFDRPNAGSAHYFFDYAPYAQTIEPWEQYAPFCQPWQTSDIVSLQIRSDLTDIVLRLYNCSGRPVKAVSFNQLLQDADNPGTWLFEVSMPLNDVPEGCGYFQIETTQLILKSEPVYIGANIANTMLWQYRNNRFKDEMIFETGFAPSLRVPGKIDFKNPASKDTIYEDQILDNVILSSRAYRIWELIIGSSAGVPDYLIDIVNRVLGCNDLTINGRKFSKATEGGKLEEKTLEDYPMRGWSIDMRERHITNSKTFNNTHIFESQFENQFE